ncbi:MAG: septum formation initiator family protein [Candidatus Moranbacteria bacterium]|nr:septum formation initiator family protein [Candidatus Moranbacteria bacterium]
MGNKSWYGSISVKIGLLAGVAILVFVGTAIYKETIKKNQIQSEIDRLREEADKISRKNSIIQDKIAYFQSKDYMEMEAKDKLNLKSPDEKVIIVKPSMATKEAPAEPSVQVEKPEVKVAVANHIKWWNYFFKY